MNNKTNLTHDSESQRRRRYKQLDHEKAEAKKLEALGYEVLSPTVVCDRVAIKDGKFYFVEFKTSGQELSKSQQKVYDLMPNNYLIVYSQKPGG